MMILQQVDEQISAQQQVLAFGIILFTCSCVCLVDAVDKHLHWVAD